MISVSTARITRLLPKTIPAIIAASILMIALAPTIPSVQAQRELCTAPPGASLADCAVKITCSPGFHGGSIIVIENLKTLTIMAITTGAPDCPPPFDPLEERIAELTCAIETDLTTLTVTSEDITNTFVVPTSTVPDGFC